MKSLTSISERHGRRRAGSARSEAGLALAVAAVAGLLAAVWAPQAQAVKPHAGRTIRWGWGTEPNSVSPARNLPADVGAAQTLWEVKLGTHQYSVPTIDRGRLYVTADDAGVKRPPYKPTGGAVLLCLEQATGKTLWQFITPRYMEGVRPPYHFDQWKCGICSSPVVDGDRVYIVGPRGEILCLDRNGQTDGNAGPFVDEAAYMGLTGPGAELQPTDGDIVWRYDLLKELGVIPHDVCGSTLLMVDDLLFACTSNGLDDRHDKVPAPDAPTLIVLDKRTGKLVAVDDEKIGHRLFHCNWSSPVSASIGAQVTVLMGGGDGMLYAFEPPPAPQAGADAPVHKLKKLWAYDCNPEGYRVKDGRAVPVSSHSRRRPDGPSEVIGVPVVCGTRVYVAIGQSPVHGPGQGCLSCVDVTTGKAVWTSTLVERTLATPAVADGLVYLPDTTGNLHCLDADTGQRYWVHPLGGKTWCCSAFVADGKVYVSNEGGLLWVLKAGRQLEVLSKTRTSSPAITATADDGVLYLPLQRSLLAVKGG